jgi:hypothetical protein
MRAPKSGVNAKEDPFDPIERSVEAVGTGSKMSTMSKLPRGAALAIGGDKVNDSANKAPSEN